MRDSAVSRYLSDTPCALCTPGTLIEAVNEAASAMGKLVPGSLLSEHMAPLDILKFEAAAKSVFTLPPLVFPTDVLYPKGAAAAFFEEIFGKYFAVTVFYRSLEKCQKDISLTDQRKAKALPFVNRLIEDLVNIPEENFAKRFDVGAFRTPELTRRTIGDLMEELVFLDCDVSFSIQQSAPDTDIGIGPGSFMKALSLLLYAANDLSCERRISVEVSVRGTVPTVTVRTRTERTKAPVNCTDALISEVPSVGAALDLCGYVAGCSGFVLSARCSEYGEVSLSLTRDSRPIPELGFRCRDEWADYGRCLAEAAELFRTFCRSGEQ